MVQGAERQTERVESVSPPRRHTSWYLGLRAWPHPAGEPAEQQDARWPVWRPGVPVLSLFIQT